MCCLYFRNNVDDVAVLRSELHNVQKVMMNDIHEIKTTDTKLDELRQENEMLKSELSNKAIKQAEDSKLYHTEITNIKKHKNN